MKMVREWRVAENLWLNTITWHRWPKGFRFQAYEKKNSKIALEEPKISHLFYSSAPHFLLSSYNLFFLFKSSHAYIKMDWWSKWILTENSCNERWLNNLFFCFQNNTECVERIDRYGWSRTCCCNTNLCNTDDFISRSGNDTTYLLIFCVTCVAIAVALRLACCISSHCRSEEIPHRKISF